MGKIIDITNRLPNDTTAPEVTRDGESASITPIAARDMGGRAARYAEKLYLAGVDEKLDEIDGKEYERAFDMRFHGFFIILDGQNMVPEYYRIREESKSEIEGTNEKLGLDWACGQFNKLVTQINASNNLERDEEDFA